MRQLDETDDQDVPEDRENEPLLTEEPVALFSRFAEEAPSAYDTGGAAGIGDTFERLWDGAKEALRQATYWQMKKRAGHVGERGLGPLLWRIGTAATGTRIHLIGHSFGGRLVSFSLRGLPGEAVEAASPVKSVLLLQAAFSHFAFAPSLPHDRKRHGALADVHDRVDGPVVSSHTTHDTARTSEDDEHMRV